MSFNSPISSGQYIKLRSASYQAAQSVSFFSNRVVFQCQCNTDLTTAQNFAAFGWHNTLVGAYSAVEVGQTILVSLTNDITQWTWRLRVRGAVTKGGGDFGSVICNETDAKIPQDAFLFFIDTFEVWDCLSRPDSSTPPIQLEDFDEPYQNLLPSITGLSYQYAGEADTTTGLFRVALALTGAAMADGASIVSWLVTPRAGQATLVSGSYSSSTVTFDLDPSTMPTWGETWFTVALTDSNGLTLTRHSGVQITNTSHAPDVGFENVEIDNDIARGWTARLPAFEGVNSILAWTLCVIWRSEEEYGGVAGALGATSNIDFVGYLTKDNPVATGDPQFAVVSQTTFDVVDVAARLSNIEMQLIGMFLDPSPVLWDHITSLNVRRGIWHVLTRHSTAPFLVDVQFDILLQGNSYLFPILSTQGQNSLAVCNGIAAQVNAALEFGPDGTIIVTRDARFLSAAERNALTTVASFNAQGSSDDCTVLNAQRTYEYVTGVIDGNGATSDASGNVQVFQSRAPGAAQGMAQGTSTLVNQILAANSTALTAQAEINQRVGNEYEIENYQETIALDFPDGYNFFIASHGQWYTINATVDLVGPNGVARIIYDTSIRWLLEQVRYTLDLDSGTRTVQVTLRRETRVGDPGLSVVIPPQPTASVLPFSFVPPAFPAFDPVLLPPEGITSPPALPVPTSPSAASVTLLWTTTQLFISFNYPALTSPTYADITPPTLGAFRVQHAIIDLPNAVGGRVPVYCLASDGTNSAVWYTANGGQAAPVWTQGATAAGVYSLIRLTATTGTILIFGQPTSSVVHMTYINGNGPATVNTGIAFTVNSGGYDVVNGYAQLYMQGDVCTSLTLLSLSGYTYGGGSAQDSADVDCSNSIINFSTVDLSGVVPNTVSSVHGKIINSPGVGNSAFAATFIYSSAAGSTAVRVSADYGVTLGSALTVGTAATDASGFDVQHGGTVSLAASDQEIDRATTLGGAYSALLTGIGAEPMIILIPWYTWGNASGKNTGSTPDFIYGLDQAVGGDTVWIVVGSTPTAVSPKISGVPGVPVGPNCITTWQGTRIAGLFAFSGTVHLMTGVITNTGTPVIVWTDRGAYSGLYIRGAYLARVAGPLYMVGTGGPKYSSDYGVNLHARVIPSVVIGIEPGG